MSATELMTLPMEIHEIIIGYLNFPSTAHLKHTNHYFDNLVKDIDIYEAEKSDYAEHHGLWACGECKFLLSFSRFSDKSKRGPRCKTGRKAAQRFCVPCGVKKRPDGSSLYRPGHRIVIGGAFHLICKNCLQFRKCRENGFSLCDECHEKQWPMAARIKKARLEAEALKERILRLTYPGLNVA